jgi:uroporphyrinogen-III synthase
MATDKIEILSTREINRELLQKAALQHINVEVCTFIKIIQGISQETTALIQSLGLQEATVIFTSVNAVQAVTSLLTAAPSWAMFCIGGATKDAVMRCFEYPAVIATAKSAALLSEKIIAHRNIKEVIFFCGNRRMDHLPKTRGASGINVREIEVYQTEDTPVHIQKEYSGILFFSPSAVHSFFSINTIPEHTVLFSIGESTTAAIASCCHNTVVTSRWPGEQEMLNRAAAYFK